MQPYKLFAQRIGLVGAANIAVSLSTLILIPILTKTIPIEQYGVWVQLTVTIALITQFAELGLPNAMSRFLAPATDKVVIQEGFYCIAVITAASAAIVAFGLLLLYRPLADALFGGYLPATLIMPAIAFFACLNDISVQYFRAFQQIKRYGLFTLVLSFGSLILVGAAVVLGYGIIGAILALLTAYVVTFVVTAAAIALQIGFRFPRFTMARQLLAYSLPLVPWGLSMWIIGSSDRYVIGLLLGPMWVGYYNPGYVLGTALMVLVGPIAFMLTPVLSSYYEAGNLHDVRTVLSHTLKYWLAVSLPLAVVVSLLSKPLLTVLSTPAIASYGYLVTPFVAASGVFYGLSAVLVQIIALKKVTRISAAAWLCAAALNIGLNFILIPRIGIVGAAISTLAAFALAFGVTLSYTVKYSLFSFDFLFLAKCVFGSAVVGSIIVLLSPSGLLNMVVTTIIAMIVYLAALLLLKTFTSAELGFFRGLLTSDASK